jgi:hypothetical protein
MVMNTGDKEIKKQPEEKKPQVEGETVNSCDCNCGCIPLPVESE